MQGTKQILKISKKIFQNSLFNQFLILTWKNILIIKRNPTGPIVEFFLSLFFISFILILRNYVEIIFYSPISNPTYDIIDFFHKTASQDLILFYPNTSLVQNIVFRAFRVIKSQKFWLHLTSKSFN